ncbi:hypothetical protein IU367_11945 [Aeromonas bestiarum]|uniref:hypothetical protein n=1 Tax=Aeromonas bestiarum TaxID=105751 RepID=UPI0023784BF0|nr:hypothetical protein [Aeromonas bestiarum]WDL80812.1 hypothetical protein IU367_11945 [Aeromonas bestiarum]
MERQKFIKLMRARGHWRDRSEDSAEIMSYIRKNDTVNVMLNGQPKGYWVNGEPCPIQLPIINLAEETKQDGEPSTTKWPPVQATKRACHVCDLGFSAIRDNCTAENLIAADRALSDNNYVFIGYHGTNRHNYLNMCENGLNEIFCGTGDGQAKGSGFYIARLLGLAKDYSDSSTQVYSEDGGCIPNPENDKATPAILRVYAKDFSIFELGIDMAWGVESTCGDPNGDKKVEKNDTKNYMIESRNSMKENIKHLEMVIAPHMYKYLTILPLPDNIVGSKLGLIPMARWPSHVVG